MNARLCVLLVLLPLLGWADVVDLLPGTSRGNVAVEASYLIDRASRLTINDVIGAAMRENQDPSLNLGNIPGHIWIKLDVANAGTARYTWILSLNRSVLNALTVYRLQDASAQAVKILDLEQPGIERASLTRFGTLAFPIALERGARATYYIRYQGPNSSALPLSIETEDELLGKRSRKITFFLAVAAGVLTLIIYNGLMYGLTGDKPFLYYTVAQGTILAYFAHLEGMTTLFLWPGNPRLGAPLAPLLGALNAAAIVAFARSHLETTQRSLRWDTVLRAIIWLSWFALALGICQVAFGIPSVSSVQLAVYAVTVITWIALPSVAFFAWLRWQPWHWPLAVAWLVMAVFIFYTTAVFAGMIRISSGHPYVYGVVAYVEAALLSLALALRIRALRARALETERELSASLARELEEMHRANELAQARSAAVAEVANQGQLIRSASHDLRQMVSTLRHGAYALAHGGSSERTSALLDEVARYLDEVLTTTTAGSYSGGFEDDALALETVPAQELLRPIMLMFEQAARAMGLTLRVRAHAIDAVTDRALLLRLLANLVGNAVKYTARGGVLVTARKHGESTLFQVHDSGPGLTADQCATLLSQRAPSERFDANGEGSGTGWKVVRALTARLGATVAIRSRLGRGTSVAVYLPPPPTGALSVALVQDQASHSPLEPLDGPGLHLHVVNADDADDRGCLHIVDLDAGGPHAGLAVARTLVDRGMQVAVSTYDHDLDIRRKIAEVTPYILYQPMSSRSIRAIAAASLHRFRPDEASSSFLAESATSQS